MSITREEYEKGMQQPPFNYSGWQLERAMKSYDDGVEWGKKHPDELPDNMKRVPFTAFSKRCDAVDPIEIECSCGNELSIGEEYFTICPDCNKFYKIICNIAQYENK